MARTVVGRKSTTHLTKYSINFLSSTMIAVALSWAGVEDSTIQYAQANPALNATVPSQSSPSLTTPERRRKSAHRKTLGDKKDRQPAQANSPKPAPALPKTVAKIDSIKQKVEVQPVGSTSWVKAQNKTPLQTSDKIRTGRQSVARLKMDDGTKVLLLQNSQAEMENLSSVEKTIKLIRGRVRAMVARVKGQNSFAIKTPIGVASVRGTEFEVEFAEDNQNMEVEVLTGQVGVSRLGDLAEEIVLNEGERLSFGANGLMGVPIRVNAMPIQQEVRDEVYDSKTKDAIVAMAAEELRVADYQTGKSLMDVDGTRVRVDEYIMRPAANQFKLVALNERPNRFDYFIYTAEFNQAQLPEDLSVALREVSGKLGTTTPTYDLNWVTTEMSNTQDVIKETSSDGHLVQIEKIGTTYKLTSGAESRDIEEAELQGDGTWKIYNPLTDNFSYAATAEARDEALQISVNDGGTFRNLTAGDTYWKTRFNTSSYYINDLVTRKTGFDIKSGLTNTLAIDLDADFENPPIATLSEYPEGSGTLHNRLSLIYADDSVTIFDNYIIDDEGNVAPSSAFENLNTGDAFTGELLKWNYQQRVTSTEMEGREINLVIDPRIGTISGLIP